MRRWGAVLRDWVRGFTDEDVRMLQYRLRLLEFQPSGSMIWLTRGQTMALTQGRVIGVWTIRVQTVCRGQARVSIQRLRSVALEPYADG